MKFRFSFKVTLICSILIIGMLLLSHWQWRRHLSKTAYINTLQNRLELPVSNISELLGKNIDLESIPYRRLNIEGDYDFTHEFTLRNRRYEDNPGVYVITPLKIKNTEKYILVSRGFIPLSYSNQEKRKIFQRDSKAVFVALAKETQTRRLFAPRDPESGGNNSWVDAWLRIDIENIQKQLPYSVLPFYVEVMSTDNNEDTKRKIVSSKSDKDDMFFLAGKANIPGAVKAIDESKYPVPVYDTVIPPTRHLGYVFEWATMAFVTFLIALILQLKRPSLPKAV